MSASCAASRRFGEAGQRKNTMKLAKTTLPRLLMGALLLGTLSFGPGCVAPSQAQNPMASVQPLPSNADAAQEINAFLTADQKQMPPTNAVLFIGSSSIRLWSTLASDFPEIPVINRGFGGSQIFESTLYADRIAAPYKPKLIVMFAGTNDLAYGNKSPQQVLQEFKDFAAKIHTLLPDTRLAYISISPTKARWNQEGAVLEANYLIQRYIVETSSPTQKLSFLDAHSALLTTDGQPPVTLERPDGLHFNAEGYKVWTSLLKPRILALADLEGVKRLEAPKQNAAK